MKIIPAVMMLGVLGGVGYAVTRVAAESADKREVQSGQLASLGQSDTQKKAAANTAREKAVALKADLKSKESQGIKTTQNDYDDVARKQCEGVIKHHGGDHWLELNACIESLTTVGGYTFERGGVIGGRGRPLKPPKQSAADLVNVRNSRHFEHYAGYARKECKRRMFHGHIAHGFNGEADLEPCTLALVQTGRFRSSAGGELSGEKYRMPDKYRDLL